MAKISPQLKYTNFRHRGWMYGVIVMFVTAIIVSTIIWKIESVHLEKKYADVAEIANKNINLLYNNIHQKLALAYPLAAIVKQEGSVHNFESIAKELMEYDPFISEIALAPNGVIKQIAPLAGNEKALGLDLFHDPVQKTEALLAHKTRKMTLTGAIYLVQGGQGLIGRLPVFVGKDHIFWGFILIVIRYPDIFNTIDLETFKEKGYAFTLSHIHPDTKAEQIIASSQKMQLDQPVETTIHFPNSSWILRVAPIDGWTDYALLIIEIAIGILIILLVGYTAKQYTEIYFYRNFLEQEIDRHITEISQTKNQLHALLDTIPDLIWLKNIEGVYQLCNPMFERFFGAKEEDIAGKTDYDFVSQELADFFRAKDRLAMEANKPSINEEWLTFADDGYRGFFETIKAPLYDDDHRLVGIFGIARDITQRSKDKDSVEQLSKMYAALSQCNQAIIHSSTAQELFEKICEYAVLLGGMSMAWIGLTDSKTNLVRPVASYGDEKHYLDDIAISTLAEIPSGQGPIGTSIRENRPFWCQDFVQDPSTKTWHDQGERMGWQSSAALPIHQSGRVIGAFTVYSRTLHAFDPMSQKLLEEMAKEISFAMDIFDRKMKREISDQHLKETEALLEEMSQFAHVGGWEFDPRTGRGTWTKELARIHDFDPNDPTSMEIGLSVYHGKWLDKIKDAIDAAVHQGIPYNLELQMITPLGNTKWVHTIGAPVMENGEVSRMRGSMQDITSQKMAQDKIEWLAHFDMLTGLPNRTSINESVKSAVSIARRTHTQLAVLFLDLDNFKNINDTIGHDVGDLLLIEVSLRMKSVMRESDVLSRQGGDEFIILLPNTTAEGAARVAEKIRSIVSQASQIESRELIVTASIGIAMYPIDGENLNALLQSADSAMYRAKHDGRNCYRFFTLEMQARTARHLELENALRHTLERHEFELYYQPQINLSTRRLIGAEALLRWKHPTLGMVSPAEFIPIAEDTGQIITIGEWVLRSALVQLKTWVDKGMEPFSIAVNLSPIQFRHPKLLSLVLQIIQEIQIPPEYLELELTEGAMIEDPLESIAIMNELHQHGIRMSIDDFGTGYSSLNYLKKFKAYKLKIDQSFIHDITDNPDDQTIVKTIINMAHDLNMETIAEGVETAEQLKFLRENGCNEIQGYYISKAIPAGEFETFVKSELPNIPTKFT